MWPGTGQEHLAQDPADSLYLLLFTKLAHCGLPYLWE